MQTLVWLDYPRRIARTRLIRRTVSRAIHREEIWPETGNVEPPLWHAIRDPDHLRCWEMRTHRSWRENSIPRIRDRFPDVAIVRFGHPGHLDSWITALSTGTPSPEKP